MAALPDHAQWLARGRAHQTEGRAVDAMLCYRRAIRSDPRRPESHFHLGEVLWQLGRLPDAMGAWAEAVRAEPGFLVAQHAIAEAQLGLGVAEAARAAVLPVVAAQPENIRAQTVQALAEFLLVDEHAATDALAARAAELSLALTHEPALVTVPAIAGMLARALDRVGDDPGTAGLRDVIADLALVSQRRGAMPAALLALACERVVERGDAARAALFFAQALGRPWNPADHDALRRIARAAVVIADLQSAALRANYSALCVNAFSPTVPLSWPCRTAGPRPRIVVLVNASVADSMAISAIEALARVSARTDGVVALLGAEACPAHWLLSATARALRVLPLPVAPAVDDARRIAALDPDLLLDVAGLAGQGGVLLAQRPARVIATVADWPLAHVAPLIDDWALDLTEAENLVAQTGQISTCTPAGRIGAAALAALWNDAVAAHGRGERERAIAGYAEVKTEQPGFAPASYLLGVAAREAGDPTAAAAHFEAAIATAPGYVEAVVAAAQLAIDRSDAAAAVAVCEAGLANAQAPASLWRVLGLAHIALRDGKAAADAFARAVALEPLDGETHYNHGVALQMQRERAEAARAYQRALFFRPDMVAADFNLGVLFQEQRANDAAIAAYETVLKADPRHVAAYKNLGEVLFAAGRIDRWLANFERFEAHCPTALPLAVQALEACQYLADFTRLERTLEGLRQEQFVARDELELVDSLEQILYLLLFFDVEPDMVHKFAQTYDAAARRVYGEPLPAVVPRRPGRLRIGYLSADLRNHVMGKMAWSAIEPSDRARFEIFLYSLSAQEDAWTAKFRALANHYEVVAALPEDAAARRIAADDLDLLVDLSTHTRGSKPGILARKPARVQITHVASAGSVGLSTIDFKLTDRYADLPANQADMIETLLPVDGCVYPYRHIEPAATHPFTRERQGVAADTFVIGAFVTGMKLSRRCLLLWREVLQRVSRAKLAFSPLNAALRAQYTRLAAAVDIGPERLLFLPQGRDEAENQARYALVDAVLDPMPFGGVNGTLEALDMGVPVVTLVGKRHGERTSYSILANLGVETTVAQTGRDYVELAVRLADDAEFMREVRATIRAGIARSTLTDRVGHTRALERAYLAALAERAPEALRASGGVGSE